MNAYKIARNQLVTEIFFVKAETVDEAFDILGNGNDPEDYQTLSRITEHSEAEIISIESL